MNGRIHATHLVVVLLHEAPEGQAEAFVWADAPVHRVHRPRRLVFVDFFSFPVKRHPPELLSGAANTLLLANCEISSPASKLFSSDLGRKMVSNGYYGSEHLLKQI